MTPLTLINGTPAQNIAANDRGLAYGQGVFETLLIRNGSVCFWPWHLERLLEGCRRLGILTDGLQQQLEADIAGLSLPQQASLKVLVTCGAGGRGYAVTENLVPTRILTLGPVPSRDPDPAEAGARLLWCTTTLAQQPLLAGLKHLNRLEQVLARAEWNAADIHEGLTCDTSGRVIEGTMSNLFFRIGEQWHTPSLENCGVAGILRRWVLERLPGLAGDVRMGEYSPAEVEAADELFVCNSLIGIWPVVELAGQHYEIGATSRHLQSLLNKEYDARC
ncbi:aminodeoxychorismate lyase [Marinobacterium lutimaris]|uniref:Aminodeoxychorismate lyase n=1 Tax=Marinobacterium lutimaris TaxID=568106 RepID=A0A1H5W1H0_9GAMM|nr:aminodeoxychorismate lyase [Marinobacterium lutimaris]SEF92981.1 aminodeoxychorismate lyase apoprotein [Marinobacterium lutimaris]